MAALALMVLVFWGWAAWMPAPAAGSWWGTRFFAASAAIMLAMFVFDVIAGLGLPFAAWAVAAVAVAGVVPAFRGVRTHGLGDLAVSPALLLPVLGLGMAALRGGILYEPLAFDELTHWALWPRMAIAGGHIAGPHIELGRVGAYAPGWLLLQTLPNLVLGRFSETHSAGIQFLLHVGLLGLVHDAVLHVLRGRHIPVRTSRYLAWAVVLAVLGAEATWRLVPTNLLIEKPQVYTLSACLLLGVLGLDGRGISQWRLHLLLGLAFAGTYLMKVADLPVGASLVVLWLGTLAGETGTRGLRVAAAQRLALMLGPALGCYVAWGVTSAGISDCLANPVLVVSAIADGQFYGEAWDLFDRLFSAIGSYLLSFKLPLTILALAGIASCLHDRRGRWLLVALLAFLVPYFAALYAYHLACFGEYYAANLNSWDRFTRVPLRVVHFFGLVLPAMIWLPRFAGLFRLLPMRAALLAVIGLAGVWQLRQVFSSFEAMATRFNETVEQREVVRRVRGEAEAISALVAQMPDLGHRVAMVAQGSVGYEYVIGQYEAYGRWRMAIGWGFAGREALRSHLIGASLVWPLAVDAATAPELLARITDAVCRDALIRHFLVPRSDGTYACLPKPGAG